MLYTSDDSFNDVLMFMFHLHVFDIYSKTCNEGTPVL